MTLDFTVPRLALLAHPMSFVGYRVGCSINGKRGGNFHHALQRPKNTNVVTDRS